MYTMLSAASAEPSRGWGGPVAILVAAAICAAIAWVSTWVRDKIRNPSPGEGSGRGVSDPAQVSAVSGSDDTTPSRRWGWLEEIGGTPWLRLRQIMRTGSMAGWDDHLQDDEPDDGLTDAEESSEEMTVAEYVRQCDDAGVAYTVMVREIIRTWGVSDSTAKRAIRQARARYEVEV